MERAPTPAREEERLDRLHRFDVLDTEPEDAFDELADLAATICGVETALITFVDEDRQWNKARVGTDTQAVDRDVAFCGHVVANPDEPLIVEDAREDARFHDNPMVTGAPGVRFYAGAPVVTDGLAIGTVCAFGDEPRTLTGDQLAGLERIADLVVLRLRERLERANLAEASSFMEGVLDSMAEQVAILDEAGTVVATNETWDVFARDRGVSPGPGAHYASAMPGEDGQLSELVRGAIEPLLRGETATAEVDYPYQGPAEERWFRMTGTVLKREGERLVVTAHRDVTPAKRAEHALRESEEQLRTLADHVDHVLWLMGPGLDEVYYVSPGFEGIFQHPRQALYDDPTIVEKWVHPDDREAFKGFLEGAVDGTEVVRYRIVTDDGSLRHLESKAFPVRDGAGQVARVAGFTRDVTAEASQRQAEQQRARQEARGVELRQIVFATSHTLQTQIRRVVSFAQLLERDHVGALDGEARELLDHVVDGVRELETLHNGLNRYGQVTASGREPAPVSLDAIVDEAIDALGDRLAAAGATVCRGELGAVEGSADQLLALFQELLANAAAARGKAPLRITVETEDEGDRQRVTVSDNGVGFPPDASERIFEVFEQLDERGDKAGAGMGLTICRRIVENHGGAITADGTPGEGAVFEMTLPTPRAGAAGAPGRGREAAPQAGPHG